jgi:hypothetical protein
MAGAVSGVVIVGLARTNLKAMPNYRLFLGAPTSADLARQSKTTDEYRWETAQETSESVDLAFVLPPATLEAAGKRISLIYQNIIFNDDDEDGEYERDGDDNDDLNNSFEVEQTTLISWSSSSAASEAALPDLAIPLPDSTPNTTGSTSFAYSDTSSIVRFPTFHIDLHRLTSLAALSKLRPNSSQKKKVNVLLAALEVEGPDEITIRKGPDAGKQVSVLKMILGDEGGGVCKLTAWRDVADRWADAKRGDILLIESTSPSFLISISLSCILRQTYHTPRTNQPRPCSPPLRGINRN